MEGMSIEEQLEFVLNFIEIHVEVYNYRIKRVLDKFENRGVPITDVINNRKSMYEKLSKL